MGQPPSAERRLHLARPACAPAARTGVSRDFRRRRVWGQEVQHASALATRPHCMSWWCAHAWLPANTSTAARSGPQLLIHYTVHGLRSSSCLLTRASACLPGDRGEERPWLALNWPKCCENDQSTRIAHYRAIPLCWLLLACVPVSTRLCLWLRLATRSLFDFSSIRLTETRASKVDVCLLSAFGQSINQAGRVDCRPSHGVLEQALLFPRGCTASP
jgi:hypothetical protein